MCGSTLGGMSGGRLLPVAKGSGRKPEPGPRRCSGCDGVLPKDASRARVFCSAACRARQWRQLRRTRARAALVVDAAAPRRACPVCGASWVVGLVSRPLVTPADIRDGDAAQVLLVDCRQDNPQLAMIWGDSAYGGNLIEWAEDELRITVKTVRPLPDQVGFKVHPRRWRVERSLPGSPSAGATPATTNAAPTTLPRTSFGPSFWS